MRIRRTVAVLVLAALAASASAAPDAVVDPLDPLRVQIDRQDELIAKEQYDTLIAEAEARVKKDAAADALYLLGRAFGTKALAKKLQGDETSFTDLLEKSQRSFEDAKEAGVVKFAPAYLGLARCARYRGDTDTAIQHLRQALQIAPGFKAASIELAQTYAEKGLGADAEFVLYKQLELRPDDADLHVLLGMIKLARKRPGEAEKEFRAAVRTDPANPQARKLLAAALMSGKVYDEAAEHLETYRRMTPKDDEGYRALFIARVRLKQRDAALRVLADLEKELPGTEAAAWAARTAEGYGNDPAAFEGAAEEVTPEALVRKLESKDPQVQLQALVAMKGFQWPALPGAVYQLLLAPKTIAPEVRRAAIELIGAQRDPRTVTLLEVLLFHPKDRDPDASVRREAAKSMAELPTPAIVPILFKALDHEDAEVREAAVRGIASVTGKYFREKLEVVTDAAGWPGERKLYDTWWKGSSSGALAKRDGIAAMTKAFEAIQKGRGRGRLAEYAFPALEDPDARTWRAGYEFFCLLTGQDFGDAPAGGDAAERARITAACREWFTAHGTED